MNTVLTISIGLNAVLLCLLVCEFKRAKRIKKLACKQSDAIRNLRMTVENERTNSCPFDVE